MTGVLIAWGVQYVSYLGGRHCSRMPTADCWVLLPRVKMCRLFHHNWRYGKAKSPRIIKNNTGCESIISSCLWSALLVEKKKEPIILRREHEECRMQYPEWIWILKNIGESWPGQLNSLDQCLCFTLELAQLHIIALIGPYLRMQWHETKRRAEERRWWLQKMANEKQTLCLRTYHKGGFLVWESWKIHLLLIQNFFSFFSLLLWRPKDILTFKISYICARPFISAALLTTSMGIGFVGIVNKTHIVYITDLRVKNISRITLHRTQQNNSNDLPCR